MKIISTVPSQTELLFDLGLNKEVVGITKFCIHPNEWYRNKIRIGGTKDLNLKKIRALNPTLIIANKEENTKEQIEALSKDYRVFVSDIKTIEDNFNLIKTIGELTNRQLEAIQQSQKLKRAIEGIHSDSKKRAAYIIWKDPMMSAGGDTFINSMLELCGYENILKNENRYPEVTFEKLKKMSPEYILLSSEPFPFKEKHIETFRSELPFSKVKLVDGEAFSWYGTRIIKKQEYLRKIVSENIQ